MEGVQKKTAAVPKNVENPKQTKMSTLDIVKRAIQTTGLPKKGASFVNIKKFASEFDEDADPKRQARSIKLALKKGLESGDLIRPNQCKNSVGATGSFLLGKKIPKKTKVPKKIKESTELTDHVKPNTKEKVKKIKESTEVTDHVKPETKEKVKKTKESTELIDHVKQNKEKVTAKKQPKQVASGYPETPKISKPLSKRKLSVKVLTSPIREIASRASYLRKSLLLTSGKKILDKYAKIRKQKILANATMIVEPRKSVTEKPKINWTKKVVDTGKPKNTATKKPANEERKVENSPLDKPKKVNSKTAKSKTKSDKTFVASSSGSPTLKKLKAEKKLSKTVLPPKQNEMSDSEDKESLMEQPEVMAVSDSEVDPVISRAQASSKETKRAKRLKKSLSDTEIHSLESEAVLGKKKTAKRQKKAETGSSDSEKTASSDTVLKKQAKGQKKQESNLFDKENDPVHSDTVLAKEKKSNARQKKQESGLLDKENDPVHSDTVLAKEKKTRQKRQKNSSSDSEKTAANSDTVVLEKKSNNQENSSDSEETSAKSDKKILAKEKKTAKKQDKGSSNSKKTEKNPKTMLSFQEPNTKTAKGMKKGAKKI